jgi:hypothetical protein
MDVAKAIRRVIAARNPTVRSKNLSSTTVDALHHAGDSAPMGRGLAGRAAATHPRSSNLALRKTITDADQHAFLEDGFEFIARFFEESLAELVRRNPGVEGRFRRNSADVFTARAFRAGRQEAQCEIQLGGGMMSSNCISFAYDANAPAGSSNEMLSAKADDQGLMFEALGISDMSGRVAKGLSHQGAADFLWALFIKSMQGDRRR